MYRAEMRRRGARVQANPLLRADAANAHVIWRSEKGDDPRRDMHAGSAYRSQPISSSAWLFALYPLI